jgi:hypothetical protein
LVSSFAVEVVDAEPCADLAWPQYWFRSTSSSCSGWQVSIVFGLKSRTFSRRTTWQKMILGVSHSPATAPQTRPPQIRDLAKLESVSAELVTSTSGALYTMQLNGPFTLFMIPTLVSDKAFNLKRYYATHSTRFYVEAGQSIQFQVATTGDAGEAVCYVSGYLLDVRVATKPRHPKK